MIRLFEALAILSFFASVWLVALGVQIGIGQHVAIWTCFILAMWSVRARDGKR